MSHMPKVFFAFRNAPERRAALRAPELLDRYRLFGLDEVAARSTVRHNLEREGKPPAWARAAGGAVNAALDAAGGYGGDFASILACRRQINEADVVFSTVDTVGIPLMLLKRAGVVRPRLVYTSIGLPERLEQLRNDRARRLYRSALRSAHTVVVYALGEAARLRDWIGADTPPVVFVPFGVDTEAFRPVDADREKIDVLSVGADPQRDFELLLLLAARRPELSFRVVATADRARSLGALPGNVAIDTNISLEAVREGLAQARIVALPVRANSYSGATTTLLQAMAMAKPVVVSRTDAIADGYGLQDGVNCRFVPPGDVEGFEAALRELTSNANAAATLGAQARETVLRSFTWRHYTDTLWQILLASSPVVDAGGR
jgi:glycosyltransferase involved in cell wall biosynthesis